MSTLALEPSDGAGSRIAGLARNADLALLAVALPIFIVASFPIAGYLAVGVAWLLQRAIEHYAATRMQTAEGRVEALRLIAGSFIARLWLLMLAILAVGIAVSEDAGLAGAVLAAALITAKFAGEAVVRLSAAEDEERAR